MSNTVELVVYPCSDRTIEHEINAKFKKIKLINMAKQKYTPWIVVVISE
jgi:hypothetical protein